MTHPIQHYPRRPSITETLYPDQDLTDGNWISVDALNNTDLHQRIDETSPADNTAITTQDSSGNGRFLTVCGSPGNEQTGIFGLPDFAGTPSGLETVTLRFRARKINTIGTGTVEARVALLQGASTVIAEFSYTGLTTSFAEYNLVLNSTQKGNLFSDTSDMRVRLRAQGCVTSTGDEMDCECSQIELDVA